MTNTTLPNLSGLPWTKNPQTDAAANWREKVRPTLVWLSNERTRPFFLPNGGPERHQQSIHDALWNTLNLSGLGQPVPSEGLADSEVTRTLHSEDIDPDDRVDLLRWLGTLAAHQEIMSADAGEGGAILLLNLLQEWGKVIWEYRDRPAWAEPVDEEFIADEEDDRRARAVGQDIKIFLMSWHDANPQNVQDADYGGGTKKRRALINACLDIQHLVAAHPGLLDDETGVLARQMAEKVAANNRTEEEAEQFAIAKVSWDQMMLNRAMDGVVPEAQTSSADIAEPPRRTRTM
jgi:hypothetical protein